MFDNVNSATGVRVLETDDNSAVFLFGVPDQPVRPTMRWTAKIATCSPFVRGLPRSAGEATATLPANHRLYAGGAGSIRGYEFQKAGPLDANNDPLGGRSLATFGAELRWRITDTIGIVPFLDGGNVYDSTVPDFSEKFFWGAGLGFRYYTDFGPLRADIAVPLDRRKNIDDAYQFYISLDRLFETSDSYCRICRRSFCWQPWWRAACSIWTALPVGHGLRARSRMP